MTLAVVAGVVGFGLLAVGAYRWWTKAMAGDDGDDVEVRERWIYKLLG